MSKTIILSFVAFTLEFLLQECSSRAIYNPGTVSETEVTHFEFIQRLGNPCGIVRLEQASPNSEYHSSYYVDDSSNNTLFYQSMVQLVDAGLEKMRLLQNPEQSLPQCAGINLDTLPTTPTFTSLNDDQLFRDIYNSGIFLAAHLHIMGMDRQLTVVGVNEVSDDNIDETDGLPSWRYLRCGNESGAFMLRLAEMTLQMENILCTVVNSATVAQRATFRESFNKLVSTTFFRYHSSCSTLQTRDCLVMKETRDTLNAMSAKFNSMTKNSNSSNESNDI
ncbi:uncharacterized protein LOC118434565 [Folsomia candida]|uniref:uncharacterized protein LOC118434565 n=1 Tax=Folsomia candida TaxID=158441 RepID=UPI001604B6E0|nr:uncharacterized protein LOC118434565 [Folsomia candida]